MLAISKIWITLGPLFVINAVLITSFFSYHLWVGRSKKRVFEGAKSQGSKFLSTTTREWWFWTTNPIVKLFVKLKMGPNMITILGVIIACIAAVLFAYGWFGYAGWAMVLGGSCDFFDGRVARMTGRSTRSGAFFDSVTDRFGEGVVFLGLAVYFRNSWMLVFVMLALIGSNLVSYTRARGEGFGVSCTGGSMQRPERVTYLGVSAILDPVVNVAISSWWPNPPPVLVIAALIFIAVMTLGTSVYRLIYVMNALDTEDKSDRKTIPQLISKLTTPEGREALWDRARYGYDRSKAAFSHVVMFHMSGIERDVFDAQIARGDLPNISNHIIGRGGKYDAIGAFPSTMGPAVTPYVTGCFPGTCDIPGVRWFDKTVPSGRMLSMNRFRDYLGWGAYAMDHDLSKSVRTIFEYSRQAVNIFGMLNRGCGFVRDPAFFRLHSRFHHARAEADLEAADEAAFHWFSSAVKRETDFVFYSFPPMAFIGAAACAAGESYKKLDRYIGRAVELMKERGMYDETVMMLVSDCSQGIRKSRFDIAEFLSRRFTVSPRGGRMKDWQDADAIVFTSGTSMSNIYLRKNGSWFDRTFIEDVERKGIVGSLLENAAIDVIAGRSIEGGIVIQSRRGRAHVLEDADGRITYMVKGGDPFGFAVLPQTMDRVSSLAATSDSEYPDCILQTLQLFRSQRTGDIVLSAACDASLANDEDAEGLGDTTHGSLMKNHIVVPVMSSLPMDGWPMRTSDVFATVIDALGIEAAHSVDGAPHSKILEASAEAATA